MASETAGDERLRLLIERIERLEEEKKGINDDIKDVYLEAKATGFDTKMMREIIRLRKMDPNDRREMQAILQVYLEALGMDRTPDMFAGHDGRPEPDRPAPAPSASESERFMEALHLVVDHQNASTSWLQRQMRIGYNAASRLIEELEKRDVVGPPNHVGRRDVLVPPNGEAHPALTMLAEAVPRKGGLKQRVGAAVVEAAKRLDEGPAMTVTTGDGVLMFENKAARALREAGGGT